MISKLKTFGVVLLTVIALCVALAPAASGEFESESASPTLSISSNSMQSFKTSAGSELTVECTTISIDGGVLEGTQATEVEVEPTYGSCENFLGQSVSVHENGCAYILNLANSSTWGTLDIECPTSTGIQITVGNICRYEIDSQTGLNLIEYVPVGLGSTGEIEARLNVSSVAVTRTTNHPPGICPNGFGTGTITGTAIITGSGILHIGLFLD